MADKTYSYKILQLKKDEALVPLLFERYSRAMKNGGVDLANYSEVYAGQISVESTWPKARVLEHLYTMFNLYHPADYRARSLSVSDIVSLCDEEEGIQLYENHYVDSVGFQKLEVSDCACV